MTLTSDGLTLLSRYTLPRDQQALFPAMTIEFIKTGSEQQEFLDMKAFFENKVKAACILSKKVSGCTWIRPRGELLPEDRYHNFALLWKIIMKEAAHVKKGCSQQSQGIRSAVIVITQT